MKNTLILSIFCFFVSCASFENQTHHDSEKPGYHQTRQLDQQSLKSSFLDR